MAWNLTQLEFDKKEAAELEMELIDLHFTHDYIFSP